MSGAPNYSLRQWQDEMAPHLDATQRTILTTQRTSERTIAQLLSEMHHSGLKDAGELRSMLAERYGLSPDSTGFLVGLAEKVGLAAFESDKQALKETFSYRNFSDDLMQLRLDESDRPSFIAVNDSYGSAHEFVMDCYYERGALEPLFRIYRSNSYRLAAVYDRLLGHLEKAERFDLIEALWTSVARKTRAEFFNSRNDEHKRLALEAYDHGINWMDRLGRIEAAARLTEEREALREERFEALPPVSDLRRIDDEVFWELISRAKVAGPSTSEQLAVLGELLRTFKPGDIKRFGALYAANMRKLYHWNVWALAYAANGGCSDDGFEAFRTWLILQADPDLLDFAVSDPAAAARQVPPDADWPDGPCVWMIEEAYLQREGSPMELPMIDLEKPKGRKWAEDELARIHPELVRYYESAAVA